MNEGPKGSRSGGRTRLGALELESGQRLPDTWVAWQASDRECFKGMQTVLVLHGLTDSHEFWADDPPSDLHRGWGNRLIGVRRAIDTSRFSVISLNMLGSCFGSTGPQSKNPESGSRYGYEFPTITLTDQATFISRAIRALGIGSVHAVVGCTYGSYVALELGLGSQLPVGRLIVLGGASRGFSDQTLIDHLRRIAVSGDRDRFMNWRRRILLSYSTYSEGKELDDVAAAWARALHPVSLLRLFEGLAASDIAPRVAGVKRPLFVVRTRNDPFFPVPMRRSRDWRFPRHTKFQTLPGAEHHAPLRLAAAYAQNLQWFLTA